MKSVDSFQKINRISGHFLWFLKDIFFYQAHIYQSKVVIMGNFEGGQIPQKKVEIRMQCNVKLLKFDDVVKKSEKFC